MKRLTKGKVEHCPVCGRIGNVAGNKYCYGAPEEKHDKARWEWIPVVPLSFLCSEEAVEEAARAAQAAFQARVRAAFLQNRELPAAMTWERLTDNEREAWRSEARAALSALQRC